MKVEFGGAMLIMAVGPKYGCIIVRFWPLAQLCSRILMSARHSRADVAARATILR